MKSVLALSYREKARDRQHGACSCSSPRPVKNDKSYTKNRINICKSCGGTCSFFLSRVWDLEKYNFDSPRGIKRQTFGIRALMLYHWATETLWWATVLQGAYEKKSIHSVALLRRPRSVAHGAIFCFLGKREGSARDEACASRRARNKNKIKKEKKKTVVDLPPSQIQSVRVDCSLLDIAFQAFS